MRNAKDIPTPNLSDDDEDVSVFGLRSAAGVTRELIDTDDSEDDASAFMLKPKQQVKKYKTYPVFLLYYKSVYNRAPQNCQDNNRAVYAPLALALRTDERVYGHNHPPFLIFSVYQNLQFPTQIVKKLMEKLQKPQFQGNTMQNYTRI